MARSSQTQMAVLGGLSIEPMTAYALREAIRDVLGHFWSESFGQIYPTLQVLEEEGHVRRREGPRARSSVFEITESGTARLIELLTEPIRDTPPRDGLLLRLFFGRTLGRARCRGLLQAARDRATQNLRGYEELHAQLSTAEGDTPDWPFIEVTIRAGIHHARATVAWADESLTALSTEEPPS
ncbi:PadR family transcriptional regulator [Actinoplanes sichuanensis]|uniref:PadR family transcriptional regulator n=1 Tax=Actinoplanes sichuanensis TaxID=512349 RepID=A0ABW3ZZE0_9ACTN|nr:PadR family transcriptional regulator [Actinoplanes sichuanensis]BEL08139.1 PadR family transcriptional regulator [Actinoplanes sichuanensis]